VAHSYLLSFLVRRHALLKAGFVKKHSHPWLVWKPLGGTPEVVSVNVAETASPGHDGAVPTVAPGDALCFELTGASRLHVGRASAGELVVTHEEPQQIFCTVAHAGGTWLVSAAQGMSEMLVSGDPLAPGIEVPLLEGAKLDLDGLSLVFWDAKSFAKWVGEQARRL
jgi:hypothetical protein